MCAKIYLAHSKNKEVNKMTNKMIRAVLFDWGRTLVGDFKEIDKKIEEILQPYGLKWDEMFKIWRNFYFLRSLGKLSTDREMFEQLRKVLNLPDNSCLEAIRDLQIDSHIITPETIEIVRKIKQHYKVGIVSNNVYDWVIQVLENHQIRKLFDVITVSSKIGARKPDARIFVTSLKSLAVNPEETVFVSDELAEDLVGSNGLGIISVWLRDPYAKSEWKHREVGEEKIFEPDIVISKLEELLPFLEKLNKSP